jgi:hypothetical protein
MLGSRIRALVSLAATMTLTVGLSGCATAPSHHLDNPAPVESHAQTIRFDNGGREYVHVYLIGHQREWLLGRVEPGAVATLKLPDESMTDASGFVQLAVISGERATLRASRDLRARTTMLQPISSIVQQRYQFAQGELLSLALRGAAVDVSRR